MIAAGFWLGFLVGAVTVPVAIIAGVFLYQTGKAAGLEGRGSRRP